MKEKKHKEEEKHCHCSPDCECGCQEGEECHCEDECCCDDECCECGHECHCHDESELANTYLEMAQRLQADFDNYRKRVAEQLDLQREEGKKSVIEVFLPCIDTFKEAKKNIADEKVLAGVQMIEDKILSALKNLGVEKIETIGQKFDHNLHEVIAILKDENKDEDVILDEFQAGWMLGGRVIRYAKVIVNKKGE
jgi:molecular chaperone GrpE